MAELRIERLGRLVQGIISTLVLEGRIKDPRVTPYISITRVQVSRDLSFADVYVSNIGRDDSIKRNVEGMQSAAGFIQSHLGTMLKVRKIPRLRFHADTSIREGFDLVQRIEQLVDPGNGEAAHEEQSGEASS
jgi:ribosome-binding factor A